MFTQHATERLQRRAGLQPTPETLAEIEHAIAAGRYQCVCPRDTENNRMLAVSAGGQKLYVVCTADNNYAVTVLSRSMVRENVRRQRQNQHRPNYKKKRRP